MQQGVAVDNFSWHVLGRGTLALVGNVVRNIGIIRFLCAVAGLTLVVKPAAANKKRHLLVRWRKLLGDY